MLMGDSCVAMAAFLCLTDVDLFEQLLIRPLRPAAAAFGCSYELLFL